jgi:hypothetical protein
MSGDAQTDPRHILLFSQAQGELGRRCTCIFRMSFQFKEHAFAIVGVHTYWTPSQRFLASCHAQARRNHIMSRLPEIVGHAAKRDSSFSFSHHLRPTQPKLSFTPPADKHSAGYKLPVRPRARNQAPCLGEAHGCAFQGTVSFTPLIHRRPCVRVGPRLHGSCRPARVITLIRDSCLSYAGQ